ARSSLPVRKSCTPTQKESLMPLSALASVSLESKSNGAQQATITSVPSALRWRALRTQSRRHAVSCLATQTVAAPLSQSSKQPNQNQNELCEETKASRAARHPDKRRQVAVQGRQL